MSSAWIASLDRGSCVLVPAEKVGGSPAAWTPAIVCGRSVGWLQLCADDASKPGSQKRFSMALKGIALKPVDKDTWPAYAEKLQDLATSLGIVLQGHGVEQHEEISAKCLSTAARSTQDIEVQVTMLSGNSVTVWVSRDASLSELQNVFASATGVPTIQQWIVFDGECLQDASARPFLQAGSEAIMVFLMRRASARDVVLHWSEDDVAWEAQIEEANTSCLRLTFKGSREAKWAERVINILSSPLDVIGLSFERQLPPAFSNAAERSVIDRLPANLEHLGLPGVLDGQGVVHLTKVLPEKLKSLDISWCRCECNRSEHKIKRDVDLVVEGCPNCQAVDAVISVMASQSSLEVVIAHGTFAKDQRNFIRAHARSQCTLVF